MEISLFFILYNLEWILHGDVAKWSKAEVCKTSIRRFESARRLQYGRGGGMVDTKDLKSFALGRASSTLALGTIDKSDGLFEWF